MTAPGELFLLAVDHRASFERLFGLDGRVGAADRERLIAVKALVVEALADVAATGGEAGRGALGVLVDDVYGAAAIEAARRSGVAVALAFERSGKAVLEFEHPDWRERLATDPPTFAKVLIRHRADGDAGAVATQLERLREISDACADSSAGFLLELIAPYSDSERAAASADELETEVRPRLIIDAITQIQDAGVAADVWKVEGVADPAGCAAITAAARAGGRDATRVVVLGAGAGVDTVNRWLESAAAAGHSGFAVGRSIWSDAVITYDRGDLDAAAARARIAGRYRGFIDTFRAAAPSRS